MTGQVEFSVEISTEIMRQHYQKQKQNFLAVENDLELK